MKQVLISLMTVLLSLPALAAGDAQAGQEKAATCNACHGANGIATNPMYPNIAGQNEAYLVSSLKAYREKQRSGGLSAVMYPMSAGLSDQDIADLAAWFASLPADGGDE
ncbi:c-type cytochrome [Salinibius halmophilus]|uniref:c-type cytochrome n=1 Tax=Salinibius halmophilus TaxID=1853216 RepID=UPI000E666357|nr:cytochrome c [Salinibius halmophilus]